MSLILDALRKMDQERRAKRQDSAALRSEVLNYRGGSSSPHRSRILPYSAIVLILIAAGGGWYFFMLTKETPTQKLMPITQTGPAASGPAAMPPIPVPVTPIVVPPVAAPVILPVKAAPEIVSPASTPPRKQAPAAVARKNGDNGITLSGIAWQEERHLRRAVINGFLMEEGERFRGQRLLRSGRTGSGLTKVESFLR